MSALLIRARPMRRAPSRPRARKRERVAAATSDIIPHRRGPLTWERHV